MHDDKSDVSCGEPLSARAPDSSNNLLRVLGDPGNGFHGKEIFSEDAFEFFQPPLVSDEVANTIWKGRSGGNFP
jgi:hypothetical protein